MAPTAKYDEGIAVCRAAGFRSIELRGDTDFSQTEELDRWHEDGVTFYFGFDSTAKLQILADDLPDSAFQLLNRPAKYQVRTRTREQPERVKQQVIDERGFKDI